MHPPGFFLAEQEFRFASGYLAFLFMCVCMYGLSFDFVRRSDYIAGVTTCLRLAQLVGAAFT
jgi:hypothetical protein